MHGASFLNRARNSSCTVTTDLDTSKRSTQKAFSCCDAILETGSAVSKSERTAGSAWETWTVAAANGVRFARVRWEINFLLTFETAPFICKHTVYWQRELKQRDVKNTWGVKQGLRIYKYTYFKAVLLNAWAAYVSHSQQEIEEFQIIKIRWIAHKCLHSPGCSLRLTALPKVDKLSWGGSNRTHMILNYITLHIDFSISQNQIHLLESHWNSHLLLYCLDRLSQPVSHSITHSLSNPV